MSKFMGTAGPWVAVNGLTSGSEVVGRKPRGGDYVVARCGGKDREANASLISAAPDLLEACQAFLEYHDAEGDDDMEMMLAYAAAVDLARAAIAKAITHQ